MPNRKTGSMPAKISQQRTKGRPKREKPVLKTPTVLRIKIPPVKNTSIDTEANQINLTKNDIKIMLANEVIRAQFPKKLNLTRKPITKNRDKPIKRTNSKKPILNHKHVLRNSNKVPEENNTIEESNTESVKTRGNTSKQINTKFTNKVPTEDPGDKIVVSPKTVKKETSKPVQLRRRKAILQCVDGSAEATSEKKDVSPKPKTVAKRKLSFRTKPGPITRQRKVNSAIKEEITTKDIPEEEKKIAIVDQKDLLNSRSSSMSELSWTRDISSSNTTTCITVSSNDFFRIDKKIPLIKLFNNDFNLKKSTHSDKKCINAGDSVSAEKNGSIIQNNCDNINILYPPLNLSTSSSDSCSQGIQSPNNVIVLSKLDKTLNKLSSKLKSFDLEVINWIGCRDDNTDNNIDFLSDKMIQGGFLREERDVILTCKEINRILSNNPDLEKETKNSVTNEEKGNNVNICNQLLNKDVQNEESREEVSAETDKDCNNLMTKQNILLEDNDDDDALSLFAESITGIDFSRRNSSVAGISDPPEVEEYIPEPVFKDTFKSPEITYRPSRIAPIDRSDATNNVMTANFCEKQNADSTSVYKENDNVYNNFIYEDRTGDFSKNFTQYNSSVIQRNSSSPRLMVSVHRPKQGIHSCVFRGVCFFNLISSCKKSMCNYPHTFIEIAEVKKKLALISENLFIEEYMMVRTWPQLRRMYGKCFVEECKRRELSRFLVEMAIDFVIKAKENSRDDNILKIDVVENILLYLNKVDLSTCADLLNYKVKNFTNVLLCDFFMNTIAESQNFSQFRSVFINLTEFMCNIQRKFEINFATVILERVSILPYDEELARALIKIIKNTDNSILSNSMIGNLEMQLMSSNLALYDELMDVQEKLSTNHTALANCYDKMPDDGSNLIKNDNNLAKNNDIRYSPDTTNLDNVNKTLEPIITRTIDLKKFRPHQNGQMSSSKDGTKIIYNNWANRTVFDNIRHKRAGQSMMPPKWPGYKRRSDRNMETRPSKYQRRNGPSFS